MRIVVLGYVVRGPMGGMAWHHLQYALGLARLGHDVYFFEDSEDDPVCYDPSTNSVGDDASYGLNFAADAFAKLGLTDRWAYYDAPGRLWRGPAASRALEICETAEVVLNVSGVNPLRPWTQRAPVRVFIDTDPLFVQVRHLNDPRAKALADQHNVFLTFGINIGAVRAIADDGLAWRATRQPVVLDCWSAAGPPPPDAAFTTVMQWDSYRPAIHDGRTFGMKSESFAPYLHLPQAVERPLELAMGNPPSEIGEAGWRLRDPLDVGRTPWSYRDYIWSSYAEFSVAKAGYVQSRSGWFSERSAHYMASGRPVLLQDTGFSDWLPVGEGVVAFNDPEEAKEGARRIITDYPLHCRRARELAAGHFGSDAVLSELLASL